MLLLESNTSIESVAVPRPGKIKFAGINRRAVALMPGEECSQARMFLPRGPLVREQLLNIELQRSSCCIKIESSKWKSRSAVLIYRGRGLASLYGTRGISKTIFGIPTYENLIAEIAEPNNILEGYCLTDEIALAAGSMFHDRTLAVEGAISPIDALQVVLDKFTEQDAPGAVTVLSESAQPLCALYFLKRRFLACKSFFCQTKPQPFETIVKYLRENRGAKIEASMLDGRQQNFIEERTFPLFRSNRWPRTKVVVAKTD